MNIKEWKEACWTFLFPAHCFGCGKEVEKRGDWCLSCESKTLDIRQLPLKQNSFLNELWAVGDYQGVLREQILMYKFSPYRRELRFSFWNLLEKATPKILCLDQVKGVCPIPLHLVRKKERGFNQAEEIFQSWAEDQSAFSWDILLERRKQTKIQSTLEERHERRENVQDAFALKEIVKMPDSILLVDDIATTGATVEEAAKVLKKAGVEKVFGLVLASGALISEENPCEK